MHRSGLLVQPRNRPLEWAVSALLSLLVIGGIYAAASLGADQPEQTWTLRGTAQTTLAALGGVILAGFTAADHWRRLTARARPDGRARRRTSIVAVLPATVLVPLVWAFIGPAPVYIGAAIGYAIFSVSIIAIEIQLRRVEGAWAGTPFWPGALPDAPPDPARLTAENAPAMWPLVRRSQRSRRVRDAAVDPPTAGGSPGWAFGKIAVLWIVIVVALAVTMRDPDVLELLVVVALAAFGAALASRAPAARRRSLKDPTSSLGVVDGASLWFGLGFWVFLVATTGATSGFSKSETPITVVASGVGLAVVYGFAWLARSRDHA